MGSWTEEQLREGAGRSHLMMQELGGEIHWIMSFIAQDKMYCAYFGSAEDVIVEHARCLNIPVDRISRVKTVIDASTAQ
jgi:hypothetical protein